MVEIFLLLLIMPPTSGYQGIESIWSHVTIYVWKLEGLRWLFYLSYATGAVITALSVLTIDHFELFGLRQVWSLPPKNGQLHRCMPLRYDAFGSLISNDPT